MATKNRTRIVAPMLPAVFRALEDDELALIDGIACHRGSGQNPSERCYQFVGTQESMIASGLASPDMFPAESEEFKEGDKWLVHRRGKDDYLLFCAIRSPDKRLSNVVDFPMRPKSR